MLQLLGLTEMFILSMSKPLLQYRAYGTLISIEGLPSAKATAAYLNQSIAPNQCPESGHWFFLNSSTQVDGLSST